MLDFLIEVLFTPGRAWICFAAGFVAAYLAWTYLPESVNRAAIGGILIMAGFVVGLIWSGGGRGRK